MNSKIRIISFSVAMVAAENITVTEEKIVDINIQNIDRQLVSPQSAGMDLKGVPQNDAVAKNEGKDFEAELNRSSESAEKPEISDKDTSSSEKLSVKKVLDWEQCEKSMEQLGPILTGIPLSNIPPLPAEKPLEVEEVMSAEMKATDAVKAPEALPIAALASLHLKDDLQMMSKDQGKILLEDVPLENAPLEMAAPEMKAPEVKTPDLEISENVDADRKPKSVEELFLKHSGVDLKDKAVQASSKNSSQMDFSEGKKEKIENLASQIFVQRNLKAEGQISFVNDIPKTVTVSSKPMADHIVRANLFSDMNVHLAKMVQKEQGGTISLELRPGDLGSMKVEVEVRGDSLRIEMSAEKSSAEGLLKNQMGELKSQLASAGFKVEELQVTSHKAANQGETRDQSPSNRGQQERPSQQSKESESQPEVSFDEKMKGAA